MDVSFVLLLAVNDSVDDELLGVYLACALRFGLLRAKLVLEYAFIDVDVLFAVCAQLIVIPFGGISK